MSCMQNPLVSEKNDAEIISSKLYTLVSNTNYGRYLEATEDIPAGTLIMEENPLVIGPEACSQTVCVGCHIPITKSDFQSCQQCGWPICSIDCDSLKTHERECSIFQKDFKKCGIPTQLGITPRYDLLLKARCLLLRDNDIEKWKILETLESHYEARQSEREPHHMAAIRYFSEVCKLDFPEETLHRVRGAILTNCINTQSIYGSTIRGIYAQASMLNHSCYPNVTLRSDSNHKICIYSSIKIDRGTPLYLSYVPITEPIWKRKMDLWAIYRFDCNCSKCSDSTEMGTFFSSLRCQNCQNNYVTFKDNWNQEWECGNCKIPISFEEVSNECIELYTTFSTDIPLDLSQIGDLMVKLQTMIHSNHFLYLNLLQEYQKLLVESNRKSFEIRVHIWKEILRVFNTLEPGKTRRKGIILLQLSSTLLKLYNEMITEDTRSTEILEEALSKVEESLDILNLEPPNSTERKWILAAVNLRKDIISIQWK